MKTIKYPQPAEWKQLLKRPVIETKDLEQQVTKVLQEIKTGGDTAVKKYTELFDKVKLDSFIVEEKEIQEAAQLLSNELKTAIAQARQNIEKFHLAQQEEVKIIETSKGVQCWRKSIAIEKVGLYIPGGTAPLFSTILMLAIPAKIAACKNIVLCTPPGKDGKINPAILYTAQLVGITTVFKLGGVQAIGAMAPKPFHRCIKYSGPATNTLPAPNN